MIVAALAAAGALHLPVELWRSGDRSVWAVSCAAYPEPGPDCTALEVRFGKVREPLGHGYLPVAAVTGILWSRAAGIDGPDVVAAASAGGTIGCVDVFAITFVDGGDRVQHLTPCHSDTPRVGVRDRHAVTELRLALGDLAFSGSNASTASVPVPAIWRDGRFTLDEAELARRSLGAEDAALRRAAVQDGLYEFLHRNEGGVAGDGAGLAVQALAGLILDGRADEARRLLRDAWPWDMHGVREPGEDGFWSELCGGVLRDPLWRALDLDRIPHADLIRAGAAAPSLR